MTAIPRKVIIASESERKPKMESMRRWAADKPELVEDIEYLTVHQAFKEHGMDPIEVIESEWFRDIVVTDSAKEIINSMPEVIEHNKTVGMTRREKRAYIRSKKSKHRKP